MDILRQIRIAVTMVLALTFLTGVAYPLLVTGLGQILFPVQANGSLITDGRGTVIGSSLIGQSFSGAQYFHPRPSAAGDEGYNATSSGGSNLGPTNRNLIDAVRERAAAYRAENGLTPHIAVPVDAVTASGSGLDPHISPANAALQIARVARARGISEDQVQTVVAQHTNGRTLGILGEPRVNVLELNLELDRQTQPK